MEKILANNGYRDTEQGIEERRLPGQLDKKERGRLRYALAAVGALGVSGGVSKTIDDNSEYFSPSRNVVVQPQEEVRSGRQELKFAIQQAVTELSPDPVQNYEQLPLSERFEAKLAGWQAWWQLNYDQIAFLDENGAPVGDFVSFENFAIDKDGNSDNGEEYLLSPGPVDEKGFLTSGIAREWIEYVRLLHAERYGVDESSLQQINVAAAFKAALNNADEPALQAGIRAGEITTLQDIVVYFGFNPDKLVKGDGEHRTRAQYLTEEINLSETIPENIQRLLRGYIVGLAAKESKFDGGLAKNHVTAEGILQLTDAVRKEHGYKETQKLSFTEEVDVAGKHFSNIYDRLQYWLQHELVRDGDSYNEIDRPDTFKKLRDVYGDGEQGKLRWQEEMLVPCIINSYNAGTYRVAASLHEFVRATPSERMQELASEKFGLFTAFAEFARQSDSNEFTAGYGRDAEAYFFSIAAAKQGIDTLLQYKDYKMAQAE